MLLLTSFDKTWCIFNNYFAVSSENYKNQADSLKSYFSNYNYHAACFISVICQSFSANIPFKMLPTYIYKILLDFPRYLFYVLHKQVCSIYVWKIKCTLIDKRPHLTYNSKLYILANLFIICIAIASNASVFGYGFLNTCNWRRKQFHTIMHTSILYNNYLVGAIFKKTYINCSSKS